VCPTAGQAGEALLPSFGDDDTVEIQTRGRCLQKFSDGQLTYAGDALGEPVRLAFSLGTFSRVMSALLAYQLRAHPQSHDRDSDLRNCPAAFVASGNTTPSGEECMREVNIYNEPEKPFDRKEGEPWEPAPEL
jgi:hypothetical protein